MNSNLLKLDMSRMELSTVVPPPFLGPEAVVEAGEGILGMFAYSHPDKVLSYYHYIGNEWQMKNIIPLPVHGGLWSMFEPRQGYIFLQLPLESDSVGIQCYCYLLDTKTLKFVETAIHKSSAHTLG